MSTILGLPVEWKAHNGSIINLSDVPEGPKYEHDPERLQRLAAWEAWRFEVMRYRHRIATLCDKDTEARRDELALCKESPAYFITVWCSLYEERPGMTEREGGWIPAVPFPFQVDLLDWIERRIQSKGAAANGIVRKPRDMGVTDIVCRWMLHGFLFRKPFSAKPISRKEDLVDTVGDMDSIMERIASHLFADEDGGCPLPIWMRPTGIDEGRKIYRQHLKISRPGNRNRIRGEATSKRSARGGRSFVAMIDEAAFIEILRILLSAVQQSTAHTILVSSESIEVSEVFIDYATEMAKLAPDSVFEIDWWQHPYRDQAWLAQERDRYGDDEAAFRREVLREPYAGFTTFIYKDFKDRSVVADDFPYEYPMPLYVGMDPGFDDETALNWCAFDGETGRYRFVEAGIWRLQEPEFYAHILAGMPNMPGQAHDEYGFSITDQLLMEQTAQWPAPILCGDPAGDNRITGRNDSFYDRLRARYLLLTGRPLDIRINWKPEKRTFQGRWNALRALLKRTDFNDTPGVKHLLNAIGHMQLETDDGRGRASEQKAPRHNWASHPTSAAEFLAVNVELVELMASMVTSDGKRIDPTGRAENFGVRTELAERVA